MPTNTGRSLSLSMRTVPISSSITHCGTSAPTSRVSDTSAYVPVSKSWLGDMRKPSALRCVWSTTIPPIPPASRPREISARMLPATMATIRPAVHFLAGATSAAAPSGTAAGSKSRGSGATSTPPWSSRNGG